MNTLDPSCMRLILEFNINFVHAGSQSGILVSAQKLLYHCHCPFYLVLCCKLNLLNVLTVIVRYVCTSSVWASCECTARALEEVST